MATELINLDALIEPKYFITIRGTKHVIRPLSVKDFIENTKALMALESGVEAETDYMARTLGKAIPSLTAEMVYELPMAAVKALLDKVKEINLPKEDQAGAAENPPKADQGAQSAA